MGYAEIVDNFFKDLTVMHEHNKIKIDFSGLSKIVLLGNANVGKSVIFGYLTGKYVTVSNYPGTTVEISRGIGMINDKKIGVIDAPGLNSLIPSSEDEKVARDILLFEDPQTVLQVADAKNLRRTLLLTIQLSEFGLPLILALNMMDELNQRRMQIDLKELSLVLGIDIVPTVATEGKGLGELKKKLASPKKSAFSINYGDCIEKAIEKIQTLLSNNSLSCRGIALMFLSFDKGVENWILDKFSAVTSEEARKIRNSLQAQYSRNLSQVIAEIRNQQVNTIVGKVLKQETSSAFFLQKLGDLSMQPLLGFPILLVILYLLYKFVGEFAAQTLVGLFEENLFGEYLNPWATSFITYFVPIKFARDFLVGEYGLITMALTYAFALILPILSCFFLFFSLLEDSGYLPRLAILLNRSFRFIGLSGKAVIPMVLGLGCDTMATMTTRTLESKKERIIATLLLALAIPCSAQLGVILGMIATVSSLATSIWLGVIILVLLLVGYLAAKIVPGDKSDFVLEIPPLRVPKLSNIFVKTLARIEWYLKEAVPLFILGTAILFFLDKFQLLKGLENLASPIVVNLLNLPPQAAAAFLIGFLRRDYGAAGLFDLSKQGLLDPIQVVVSLVTITLFVPCIAQFLVMIKERGLKTALAITLFVFPFAFLVGGLVNFLLRYFKVIL